jgi:hypothetical protein
MIFSGFRGWTLIKRIIAVGGFPTGIIPLRGDNENPAACGAVLDSCSL